MKDSHHCSDRELALSLAKVFSSNGLCDLQVAMLLVRLSGYDLDCIRYVSVTLKRKLRILVRTGSGYSHVKELVDRVSASVHVLENEEFPKDLQWLRELSSTSVPPKKKRKVDKILTDNCNPASTKILLATVPSSVASVSVGFECDGSTHNSFERNERWAPESVSLKIFSQSPIWQQSVDFYKDKGVNAWLENGPVPFAISNSRMLANSIATNIIAWAGTLGVGSVDSKALIVIFEIGAGTCAFGFHLATCLRDRHAEHPTINFRVVMTDISRQVIESRSKHPAFQTLIHDKLVDFSEISPNAEGFGETALESFKLSRCSSSSTDVGVDVDCAGNGDRLQGTINGLLQVASATTVVANYLFDSLHGDLWFKRNGNHVSRIMTSVNADGALKFKVEPQCCTFNATTQPYTGTVARVNEAFHRIASDIPEGSPLFFPCGTVSLMHNVLDALKPHNPHTKTVSSPNTSGCVPLPCLVLVSDKTFDSIEDYECPTCLPPGLAKHGDGRSIAVDMHHIGLVIDCESCVHSSKVATAFETSCFLLGHPHTQYHSHPRLHHHPHPHPYPHPLKNTKHAAAAALTTVRDVFDSTLGMFGGAEWEMMWSYVHIEFPALSRLLSFNDWFALFKLSAFDYEFWKLIRWHIRHQLHQRITNLHGRSDVDVVDDVDDVDDVDTDGDADGHEDGCIDCGAHGDTHCDTHGDVQRVVDAWVVVANEAFASRYEHKATTHALHEPLQHARWLYSLNQFSSAHALVITLPQTTSRVTKLLSKCSQRLNKN